MPDVDFFNFFRYMLGIVAGVYATVVTIQSLYGWYVYLNSGDRYITLIRRYVVVQGLRLRLKSFLWDVLICILLTVIFFLVWYAHSLVYEARDTLRSAQFDEQRVLKSR